MKINNIIAIREYINDGITYGVYSLNFNDRQEVFIKNGNSVGVVTLLLGELADKCVCIIRDDVKQEFLDLLNKRIR